MAELLCECGIEVKAVTTDPDNSASRKGQAYQDTRHLIESIRKSIKRVEECLKVMLCRTEV